MRARCLSKWFYQTTEVISQPTSYHILSQQIQIALQLEYAISGAFPDGIDLTPELRRSVMEFKGFRHELIREFKGKETVGYHQGVIIIAAFILQDIIAQESGIAYDHLSDAEIDQAIDNLTIEDKQQLSRSKFCYLWGILTHSATRLVSPGLFFYYYLPFPKL